MIRDIAIHAVLNGFVVTVGCQTLVYESRTKLMAELGAYLDDPEGVEQRVVREGVNARHTYAMGVAIAPTGSEDMPAACQAVREYVANSDARTPPCSRR
jgi:hypothetical protein